MGFDPLSPNQPTWLGWTRLARVWVDQTDPAQPSLSPPLFLARLWQSLIAAAVARPAPVTSAADVWGKTVAPTPSTPSSNWIRRELPLRGDRWLVSPRFLPSPVTLGSMPRRALSWCLLCDHWCLWCVSTRRWKRRGVVLPVCSVKSTLGSLWPAAQALPCHAV
jgi:hypothetical protein